MLERLKLIRYPISVGTLVVGLLSIGIGLLVEFILNMGVMAGLFAAWGMIVIAIAVIAVAVINITELII